MIHYIHKSVNNPWYALDGGACFPQFYALTFGECEREAQRRGWTYCMYLEGITPLDPRVHYYTASLFEPALA
jgi:hypothetical protein